MGDFEGWLRMQDKGVGPKQAKPCFEEATTRRAEARTGALSWREQRRINSEECSQARFEREKKMRGGRLDYSIEPG